MGAPITIDNNALFSSFHWSVHADRFNPELERMKFDINGSHDKLKAHLLTVTDTDALKHVLVTARGQLESHCTEKLAQASPSNARSLQSWNANYLRYYDGFVAALVHEVCGDLPSHERPQLSEGRSL